VGLVVAAARRTDPALTPGSSICPASGNTHAKITIKNKDHLTALFAEFLVRHRRHFHDFIDGLAEDFIWLGKKISRHACARLAPGRKGSDHGARYVIIDMSDGAWAR
jgi:hypothetical protein